MRVYFQNNEEGKQVWARGKDVTYAKLSKEDQLLCVKHLKSGVFLSPHFSFIYCFLTLNS